MCYHFTLCRLDEPLSLQDASELSVSSELPDSDEPELLESDIIMTLLLSVNFERDILELPDSEESESLESDIVMTLLVVVNFGREWLFSRCGMA